MDKIPLIDDIDQLFTWQYLITATLILLLPFVVYILSKTRILGAKYSNTVDYEKFRHEENWTIVDGFVYDFGDFKDKHPGGITQMNQMKGIDATKLLRSKHPLSHVNKIRKVGKWGGELPKGG